MIPFMSSVSTCVQAAHGNADEDSSNYIEYKERLKNCLEGWGFQAVPVLGDGNCCFASIAYSIWFMKDKIRHEDPALLNGILEENETFSISQIANKLRHTAVQEWCNHPEDYLGFLETNDRSVLLEEAEKFKEEGYFFGPLSDTMVLAISNATGIPIVIFSSALYYPIIYITPRNLKTHISLYVAFNQAGAGHYDSVVCKSFPDDQSTNSSNVMPNNSKPCCTCGRHDGTNETPRFVPLQSKYTTIIKCPCFLANIPCN